MTARADKGLIFISYRRDDSAGFTRAIYEQLLKRFSKDRVFMDVVAIEPGLAFDQVIDQAVGRCEVVLVMIGKDWLERTRKGGSRLDDEKDFVRIEIGSALSRDIRVIPVLLDGAVMPREADLPKPLRPLVLRNAIEVGNTRFENDVARLSEAIGRALGETAAPSVGARRPLLYWLMAGAAAIAMVPLGLFIPRWLGGETTPPEPMQRDWRFCQKCQSMFFDGYADKGVCPATGQHSAQGYNFNLPHDVAHPEQLDWRQRQGDWRHCEKCRAMFFDGYPNKGVCPAGGGHFAEGYNFFLFHDVVGFGQRDWRYCEKCHAMFYDGFPDKGVCPAGGAHLAEGYNFVLSYLT